MNNIDDLFKDSIRQYENLIDVASSMCDNMDSLSPESILKQCQQLSSLQKKQRILDDFLVEVIADSGSQVLFAPDIGNYQRILGKASLLCDTVAVKAKARKCQLKRSYKRLKEKI